MGQSGAEQLVQRSAGWELRDRPVSLLHFMSSQSWVRINHCSNSEAPQLTLEPSEICSLNVDLMRSHHCGVSLRLLDLRPDVHFGAPSKMVQRIKRWKRQKRRKRWRRTLFHHFDCFQIPFEDIRRLNWNSFLFSLMSSPVFWSQQEPVFQKRVTGLKVRFIISSHSSADNNGWSSRGQNQNHKLWFTQKCSSKGRKEEDFKQATRGCKLRRFYKKKKSF